MKNDILPLLTLTVAVAFTAFTVTFPGTAVGQQQSPSAEPGWTGVTDPDGVIAARQALMIEMERLIRPIDTYAADAAGEAGAPDALRSASESIAAMLLATPHLFPPTTDLYDDADEIPRTLALPAIWQEFAAFEAMAAASAAAASRLLVAESQQLRDAAVALRASCDSCHAFSMKQFEYAPPEVTDEDLDIDFDSLFGPD